MSSRTWRPVALLAAASLLPLVLACPGPRPETETAVTIDCSAGLGTVSLDCPSLPVQPPVADSQGGADTYQQYENFAWKAFVALNWPAQVPASPDYYRGFYDPSQSFTSQNSPQWPVWATWKEKREIFYYGPPNATQPVADPPDPGPWNQPYNYLGNDAIPPCAGAEDRVADAHGRNVRLIAQATKVSVVHNEADSLDETVEVNSEAYYPEEIRGRSVEPRVWQGSFSGPAILYEVKVNYDYYDYVRSNQLYVDTTKSQQAEAANINFPKRKGTYDPTQCAASNKTPSASPCLTGVIQTKAAWLPLDPSDPTYSSYHTTEALYYKSTDEAPGICQEVGHFGLVGFHIIQKTSNQGFYVYATWEHKQNDDAGFVYANFSNVPSPGKFYPSPPEAALAVTRMHPIFSGTQATNQAWWASIQAANPSSVWLNYELVGTQFLPVQSTNTTGEYPVGDDDPTGIGQPFYLANLTLETNWGLQNFQGVPPFPAFAVVDYFANPPTAPPPVGTDPQYPTHFTVNQSYSFDRSLPSIGYNRRQPNGSYGGVFVMGGCMGCHGVAQAGGTDFSFVLQRGQRGAQPDTLKDFYDPG